MSNGERLGKSQVFIWGGNKAKPEDKKKKMLAWKLGRITRTQTDATKSLVLKCVLTLTLVKCWSMKHKHYVRFKIMFIKHIQKEFETDTKKGAMTCWQRPARYDVSSGLMRSFSERKALDEVSLTVVSTFELSPGRLTSHKYPHSTSDYIKRITETWAALRSTNETKKVGDEMCT